MPLQLVGLFRLHISLWFLPFSVVSFVIELHERQLVMINLKLNLNVEQVSFSPTVLEKLRNLEFFFHLPSGPN